MTIFFFVPIHFEFIQTGAVQYSAHRIKASNLDTIATFLGLVKRRVISQKSGASEYLYPINGNLAQLVSVFDWSTSTFHEVAEKCKCGACTVSMRCNLGLLLAFSSLIKGEQILRASPAGTPQHHGSFVLGLFVQIAPRSRRPH